MKLSKGAFITPNGRKLGYLLHSPDAAPVSPLPVIVYLHGTDGCGDDPHSLLNIESLPSYIENGSLTIDDNALVLAPQCPKGLNWDIVSEDTVALIEHISKEYCGDINMIALTGASLGGMGTFSIAIKHPYLFSCLVPVCGSVAPEKCAELSGTPVWIFHGAQDVGMGFSVVEAADIIKRAGGICRLTMLEGWGHEIRWIYKAPEFNVINWMMAQKRSI